MVFNATSNNISVISWQSFFLVEKTRVLGETTDQPQVTDKLYYISHNAVSSTSPHESMMSGIQTHNISGDRH